MITNDEIADWSTYIFGFGWRAEHGIDDLLAQVFWPTMYTTQIKLRTPWNPMHSGDRSQTRSAARGNC